MPIIPDIVEQHAEDAAFNWLTRDSAVSEPSYSLADITRLDERIEADIDGLLIAGEDGWDICRDATTLGEPGEIFTAGVIAFGSEDSGRMDAMLAAVELDDELRRALVSAMGWLDLGKVVEPAGKLVGSSIEFLRHIGLSTLSIHRHDPGSTLLNCLLADNPVVRARALKSVGELGRRDLLNTLKSHFNETDSKCLYYAAWSAALLGDQSSTGILRQIAENGLFNAQPACSLAARLMQPAEASDWLQNLAEDPYGLRLAINGYGAMGDPESIPIILDYMTVPALARPAGEAFSTITGVDITYENLETDEPEGFEAGPTEDPDDEDVEMDPDEDLPWPDLELIAAWWNSKQNRFQKGARYLAGKTISEDNCGQVLLNGNQRQRRAAALELAIMHTGQPLFEIRAPGYRQQHMLTKGG